jgi:hypothetical protein
LKTFYLGLNKYAVFKSEEHNVKMNNKKQPLPVRHIVTKLQQLAIHLIWMQNWKTNKQKFSDVDVSVVVPKHMITSQYYSQQFSVFNM